MDDVHTFLQRDAVTVARELIGWRFYVCEDHGSLTGGRIVETEAYNQDDAASHSFNGPTKRTQVMFGPAGHMYVYFTYGMHWCANIVVGQEGRGEAVLLRALQLDQGFYTARIRRHNRPDTELTNGPAKLCQALGITGEDSGASIDQKRFVLKPRSQPVGAIQATTRIGISQDTHRLWRFVAS